MLFFAVDCSIHVNRSGVSDGDIIPHRIEEPTTPNGTKAIEVSKGDRPEHSRRLLIVVNDASFFLSHRVPIALAAKADGWEVHVATPPSPLAGEIERRGLNFHPVPISRSGLRPYTELRSLIALYRLYKRLAPDLVHHVTIKPVLYGGIVARLARVPAVISAISGLGYVFSSTSMRAKLLRRITPFVYRLGLRHPNTHVIVQNPHDREQVLSLSRLDPALVTLIRGSGVDLERFRVRRESVGTPIVMYAGRMMRDKGVADFVESAKILQRQGCQVRCVLVGPPDPDNPSGYTAEELRRLRDSGVVEWWGMRDDMDNVLSEAQVFCLPSYYGEGVPKVLLEAAACGRAIVTTRTPGCDEVVRDGYNGLLIPPRDPQALAEAIARLLDNPSQRHEMGRLGRQRAEQEFSVEAVIQEHMRIYRALAGH